MNTRAAILLMLALGSTFPMVTAGELSGSVSAEGKIFAHDASYPGQKRDDASLALRVEYYHEWEGGSSFVFVPFARLDSSDSERSHVDIRELNLLWLAEDWELRLGIGKVFWGATEFVHLVDIINQTDSIESIDGEDKLGQPMIHLSVPADWGILDAFVLPYFRERTFPGSEGRLRSAVVIDTDNAEYESSDEEQHVDLAIRYSHTIGDIDFGIYHFRGTGREPLLRPRSSTNTEAAFVPYYELIDQTGLDAQLVAGEWLLKLEALYRSGQSDDFFAAVGGVEYTFTGVAGTDADLGLIAEYAYDDRDHEGSTAYQNDTMLGARLALNDLADSQLLAGVSQDMDHSTRALSIEGSRRFGSNWKATLEAWVFLDAPEDDPQYGLRNDSFVQLEIAYHF